MALGNFLKKDNDTKESKEENVETLDSNGKELSEGTDGYMSSFKDKFAKAKDGVKDMKISEKIQNIDIMGKLKGFVEKSVALVSEIDEHLNSNNSMYQVDDFRINGSFGLKAGMTLDIHFVKSQVGKAISVERSKNLVITNPKTGKSFKIARMAVATKEKARIKDPSSGEVLLIDTKTGAIIDENKKINTEEKK